MPERTCTVPCAHCGTDVQKLPRELKRYPVTYCDKACSARARWEAGEMALPAFPLVKHCATCGNEFHPTSPAVKWCDACNNRLLPIPAHQCAWCRDAFPAPRNRKYCTTQCATEARREAQLQRLATQRKECTYVGGTCAECGAGFLERVSGNRASSRFCSRSCWQRNRRRRGKAIRSKRIRTAAARELIDLPTVAQRDNWRCHICKRTVTRRTWSLDHLVPLVYGGSHTYDNVALAHSRCNAKRGAASSTQLHLVA